MGLVLIYSHTWTFYKSLQRDLGPNRPGFEARTSLSPANLHVYHNMIDHNCVMYVVVLIAMFVSRSVGQDQAQYTDLRGGSVTPTGQRSG